MVIAVVIRLSVDVSHRDWKGTSQNAQNLPYTEESRPFSTPTPPLLCHRIRVYFLVKDETQKLEDLSGGGGGEYE
jgi:hypothetical protein